MRKICYHVAITLDGFIARLDGSIDGFLEDGDHVEDYLTSLIEYDSVIMGRKTYEFGYAFGLQPGHRAYPHMENWIFSKSLDISSRHGVNVVKEKWLETLGQIQKREGSDIYLCGGSVFAGWLLSEGKIDHLKLKLNPVVFGEGLPLFTGVKNGISNFDLVSSKIYNSGVILLGYQRP